MGNSFRQTLGGIFSDSRMNQDTMLSGHVSASICRSQSQAGEYLIAAQDTTFYNYSGQKQMEGLGRIQGNVRGVVQHNVLLMNTLGVPLGILGQQYWSREGSVEFDGKESKKWERGLKLVNQSLSSVNKRVVLVQDREADIFDFFKSPRASNIDLLVRVHQPRNIEVIDSGVVLPLPALQSSLGEIGQKTIQVTRSGKEITVTLCLKANRVHVLPNKDFNADKHKTSALSLVIAQEIAAVDPQGNDVFEPKEAALWYLLSSLPIDTQQDIERVVDFYALRWIIERFHYTMKSGALNVERLQFDDLQTTINALSFYSVVAWQLLTITYLLRQTQNQPPEACFDTEEIEILEKISNKKIASLKEAVGIIAKIVNFVPTKKQPWPGVKVLAQAMERLYYIKLGFNAKEPL